MTFEGEWAAPERDRFTFGSTTTLVSMDRRWFYLRDGESVWVEGPPNPLGLPRWRGRAEIPDLDSASIVGEEVIDGVPVYHILGDSIVTRSNTGPLTVLHHLYIAKADSLLVRAPSATEGVEHVSAIGVAGDGDAAVERAFGQTETQEFSAYNDPIMIELPEDRVDRPDPDAPPSPIPTPTPTKTPTPTP